MELRLSCILMSRGECHTPTVLSIRVKPNVCVKIYHCVNGDVDTKAKGLEQFLAFVFVYLNGDVDTNVDLEKFCVFVFGNEWITFELLKKLEEVSKILPIHLGTLFVVTKVDLCLEMSIPGVTNTGTAGLLSSLPHS